MGAFGWMPRECGLRGKKYPFALFPSALSPSSLPCPPLLNLWKRFWFWTIVVLGQAPSMDLSPCLLASPHQLVFCAVGSIDIHFQMQFPQPS